MSIDSILASRAFSHMLVFICENFETGVCQWPHDLLGHESGHAVGPANSHLNLISHIDIVCLCTYVYDDRT